MTTLNNDGFQIDAQDLSAASPTSDDHQRVYNHDGSATITLTDGSTTSKRGWYIWDNPASAWFPMGQHADLVDGYHGADLAALADNETITGSWTFNNKIAADVDSVDGYHASALAALSEAESISGAWNIDTANGGDLTIANGAIYHESHVPNFSELAGVATENQLDFREQPISINTTKWADGLSNEEIWRLSLPTGDALEVHSLDLQLKGGGALATPSNMTVDIYDVTNATVIATDSADGAPSTGDPIGSTGTGVDVIARISNSDGTYHNASIEGRLHIV